MSRIQLPICLALLTVTTAAFADDKAIAEALFRKGRALLDKNDVAGACASFEESERLDPGHIGTLLNLAECHEQLKKWARAWAEYSSASQKITGSDPKSLERRTLALDGLRRLKDELSTISIAAPPEEDVVITLDGEVVAKASYGVDLPLDPGTHSIVESAPGKKPLTISITIGEKADHQRVTPMALDDAPAPATSPIEPKVDKPAMASSVPPENDPPAPSAERSNAAAWIFGGGGVALIGGGIASHFVAASAHDDRARHCSSVATYGCSDDYKVSTIHTWNALTIGGLAVGAASIGVATVLFLRSDGKASPAVAVGVGPGTMSIAGSF